MGVSGECHVIIVSASKANMHSPESTLVKSTAQMESANQFIPSNSNPVPIPFCWMLNRVSVF